jgi:hypothetical protein
MKRFYATLLSVALLQSAAYAEQLSGTVKEVKPDDGKLTITRSDNQKDETISVKDKTSLSQVQVGSTIQIEASKGLVGGYEANTASGSGSASTTDTGTMGTGSTAASDATGATADNGTNSKNNAVTGYSDAASTTAGTDNGPVRQEV